ncbi:MAG: hypothetical protein WBE77_05655 [Candidatus Cybelea sp.]
MVFLEINGMSVEAAEDDVVQVMLGVATKELDVAGIAEFLEERATHVSTGPVTIVYGSTEITRIASHKNLARAKCREARLLREQRPDLQC